MEEKNSTKTKNNSKIIIIVLVLLILVIFGMGIFITYNNSKRNANNRPTEIKEEKDNKPEKEENNIIELDEDNEEVKEAKSLIPIELCGPVYFPFERKNILVDDLNNNYKFNMLAYHYYFNFKTETENIIEENELRRYFANLKFLDEIKKNGFDSSYNIDTGEAKNNNNYESILPLKLTYKDDKYYFSGYSTGCTGPGNDGGRIKFKSAKKVNDGLELTYYYYYQKIVFKGDNYYFNIYNYKDGNIIYGEITDEKINDDYMNLNEFDTYTLYFDTSNDNMRFIKMVYNN